MTSIETVNDMTPWAFIEAFGEIAEHSPWVAREAETSRDRKSVV